MEEKAIQSRTKGIILDGVELLNAQEYKELKSIYAQINNKTLDVFNICKSIGLQHFEAGLIICTMCTKYRGKITLKKMAELTGFKPSRVSISTRIYQCFEGRREALEGLNMQDIQKLIREPREKEEGAYNRLEFGGGIAGEKYLPFDELPILSNIELRSHRVESSDLTNIMVFHRWNDGKVLAKRYVQFFDDVPQDPDLRRAYKQMVEGTQALIEEFYKTKESVELGGV